MLAFRRAMHIKLLSISQTSDVTGYFQVSYLFSSAIIYKDTLNNCDMKINIA